MRSGSRRAVAPPPRRAPYERRRRGAAGLHTAEAPGCAGWTRLTDPPSPSSLGPGKGQQVPAGRRPSLTYSIRAPLPAARLPRGTHVAPSSLEKSATASRRVRSATVA
ncbi:hypothetical protein AOLI_G00027950 [Acnodon oligacanthus]